MSAHIQDLDIGAASVIADPYSYFGELRERDPIIWNPLAKLWIVTRYEEVVSLLRDAERFSSDLAIQPRDQFPPLDEADWELAKYLDDTFRPFMVYDRPEHQRMRGAIHRRFTPRAVEEFREEIRGELHGLIESLRPRGEMELKNDLAVHLPLRTITWMLGVPPEDAPRLHELTNIMVAVGFGTDRTRKLVPAWDELQEYFGQKLAERRAQPSDDLLFLLADALRTGAYTEEQAIASAVHLMMAGHGTTLNLITNGMYLLLTHPEQWELLKADPAGRCAATTEECLRYEPSLKALMRVASRDLELGDARIPAGDTVMWVIASANRDPRVFSDPEEFDIGRAPNPHVAFGGGIHHCLGAALARVEGQEAFRALAEQMPDLELTSDPVEYVSNLIDREMTSLRVTWEQVGSPGQ